MRRNALALMLILFLSLVPSFPIQAQLPSETDVTIPHIPLGSSQSNLYWISVVKEREYGLRGEAIELTVNSNASQVQVQIYDPDQVQVYDQTWDANSTRSIPIGNTAKYGTYTIKAIAEETVATSWFTVLDVSGWSQPLNASNFPIQIPHNGLYYTFYANWTVQVSLGEDSLWVDFTTLRELSQQYNMEVIARTNQMNFLVRFTKASILVDLDFAFIHSGAKIIINGTLDQSRDIALGFTAKQFKNWVSGVKSGHIIFDWSDIPKEAFSYNAESKELICHCPQNFRVDPVIFEDGFESGLFSAWSLTSGSPQVVSDPVHQGGHAAEFDVNYERAQINYAGETELYASIWFRLSALPGVNEEVRIFSFRNSDETRIAEYYVAYAGGTPNRIELRTLYPSDYIYSDEQSLSVDTWYYARLHFKKDASTGRYQAWLGDSLVCDSGEEDTSAAPDSNSFRIGRLDSDYTVTVAIDDVTLSTTSIGMEPEYYSAYLWAAEYSSDATNPENILGGPDKTFCTAGKGDYVYASAYETDDLSGTIRQVYFEIFYYGTVSGTLDWYYQLDDGGFNSIETLPEGGSSSDTLFRTYNATTLRGTWTWSNINDTDVEFINNDAGGPESAYVDAIFIKVYYEELAGQDLTFPLSESVAMTATLTQTKSLLYTNPETVAISSTMSQLKELSFQFSETATTTVSLDFIEQLAGGIEKMFEFLETSVIDSALDQWKALFYASTESASPSDSLGIGKENLFSSLESVTLDSALKQAKELRFSSTESVVPSSMLRFGKEKGFVLPASIAVNEALDHFKELLLHFTESMSPGATVEQSSEQPPSPPTGPVIGYFIYRDGSTYHANSTWGGTNYTDSNFVTVLESALAACPSGNVTWIMGPDVYTANEDINNIPSYSTIIGNASDDRPTINGTLTNMRLFDINGADNVTLYNLNITMHGTVGTTNIAVEIDNSEYSRIYYLKIRGARSAIVPHTSPHLEIKFCDILMTVEHSAMWGGSGCHYMEIENNTIGCEGIASWTHNCIGAFNNAENMTIAYNDCFGWGYDGRTHAIYIDHDCNGSVIHHNDCHDDEPGGGYAMMTKSQETIWEYNHVYNCTKGMDIVETAYKETVRYNTFENISVTAILLWFQESYDVSHCVIDGNIINNCDESGITIGGSSPGTSHYNEVANNQVEDCPYGIRLKNWGGSIEYCVVHDNIATGNTYDLYNDISNSNIEYNNVYDSISWLRPTDPYFTWVTYNTTTEGEPCEIQVYWHDGTALSKARAGSNATGSWVWGNNETLSGQDAWLNQSIGDLPSAGNRVEFRSQANDTSDNWGDTYDSTMQQVVGMLYFTVTETEGPKERTFVFYMSLAIQAALDFSSQIYMTLQKFFALLETVSIADMQIPNKELWFLQSATLNPSDLLDYWKSKGFYISETTSSTVTMSRTIEKLIGILQTLAAQATLGLWTEIHVTLDLFFSFIETVATNSILTTEKEVRLIFFEFLEPMQIQGLLYTSFTQIVIPEEVRDPLIYAAIAVATVALAIAITAGGKTAQ